MLSGFMNFHTSLPKLELFFNNEEYLKTFTTANKTLHPVYNYFSMLQSSINGRFGIGEKYLEFLLFLCVDTCDQFSKLTLIGLKCHKIPKPMLDYSADGFHYLLASKTSSKMNDMEREIGNFQKKQN